jgi:hypothetical protein
MMRVINHAVYKGEKMTAFTQAVINRTARTVNGMQARASSGHAVLDLFYQIGASRGRDVIPGFVAALANPLNVDITAVRKAIRASAPGIIEEIKWKASGFRTTESFATVKLRSTDRLQLFFISAP